MTFSIVARCNETGMFGMAISSSSPAVAARCAHARAGVGAVASQNVTDPSLGPLALGLLADGQSAKQVIETIVGSAPDLEYRQLLIVDADGGTAFTVANRHWVSGPRHGTWTLPAVAIYWPMPTCRGPSWMALSKPADILGIDSWQPAGRTRCGRGSRVRCTVRPVGRGQSLLAGGRIAMRLDRKLPN